MSLPLLVVFISGTEARAQVQCNGNGPYIVPYDWPLKPSGLAVGKKFRLLFVTSTKHKANKKNIAHYNNLVQTRAKAGHEQITDSCGNQFKVLGSTDAVDARNNTSTTGTGEAIYWLKPGGGNKVADNYADFYDGSWDNFRGYMTTESGIKLPANNNQAFVGVFTGSENNGTKYQLTNLKGGFGERLVAFTVSTQPLTSSLISKEAEEHFYALSPIFQVDEKPTLSIRANVRGNETDIFQGGYVRLSQTRSANTTVVLCVKDTSTATFRTASGGKARDFDISAFDLKINGQPCGSYTILAGSIRVYFSMRIFQDTTPEADETVVLELRNPPEGVAISSTAGTFTHVIVNNDGPPTTITVTGGTAVTEGTGAQFTVNASQAPSANLTVQLDVSDDDTSDFVAAGDEGRKTVTIPASQTSATFTVDTVADSTDEANGAVTVVVAEGGDSYVVGSSSSAQVTVNDGPTLSLRLDAASGDEGNSGNSEVDVTILLSPTRSEATTFDFCVKDTGTAVFRTDSDGKARDFDIVNYFSGTQLLMPQNCHNYTINGNEGRSAVKLRIFGDTMPELSETVILELRKPPSDVVVSPTAGTATYTINTDDGTPPILSISGTTSRSEGSVGGTFRHLISQRLSRSRSTDTTFFLCLKNTSTATFRRASGGKARDFDISSFGDLKINGQPCGRYTIPAGSMTMFFGMIVYKDNRRELDETVILELRNPPEGVVTSSTAGTFTHTIVNDDGAPTTITITGGTAVTEGTGAQFTVNASPAPSAKLKVQLDVSDDDTSDFVAAGDEGRKTVTIPARQTSATFTVNTVADNTKEANGDVTVVVAEGDGYVAGNSSSAQVTVNDGPTLSLSVAPNSRNEGDSSHSELDVTISLSSTRSAATVFDFCVKNTGTATFRTDSDGKARDFDIINFFGNGPLRMTPQNCHNYTIPGNSGRSQVKLRIFGDTTAEADETVILELRNPSSGVSVSSTAGTATYTINNNDGPPTTITVTGGTAVTEGTGAQFTVNASQAPSANLTVQLDVSDNDTSDFVAAGDEGRKTVIIPAGQTSATFTVNTVADSTDEPNGDVTVVVAGDDSYVVSSSSSAQVTVNDGPTLSLSMNSTSGNEDNSGISHVDVIITLNPTRSAATAFDFCVKDTGTATFRTDSGGKTRDFDIVNFFDPSPLFMNPQNCHNYTIGGDGNSSVVKLRIFGDTTAEADETAILELRNPPNGVAVSSTAGTATYTINNDDGTPTTITVTGGAAVNAGTASQFTVNASPAPNANLTVQLDVSDDDTSDLVAASDEGRKTVTIPAGQTSAIFTVNTVLSSTEQPNGEVTVTVAAHDGYVVGDSSSAQVTVNEVPILSLDLASASNNEGTRFKVRLVTMTISLSRTHSASTRAKLCVKNTSTAIFRKGAGGNNRDFTLVRLTNNNPNLNQTPLVINDQNCHIYAIPAGSTEWKAQLRIVGDRIAEEDETVVLELRDPTNGVAVSSTEGTTTYTIVNDDRTPPMITVKGGSAVTEGTGAKFTVNASPKPYGDLTVRLRVSDDDTSDFVAAGNEGRKTVTIRHNRPSATFTVNTVDDSTEEASGDVTVKVISGDGYVASDSSSAQVTVYDDDTPPTITVTGGSAVTEGTGAKFTVNVSPPPSANLTVQLDVSDDDMSDFVVAGDEGRKTVAIPAGQTSATFTVNTVADSTEEANGAVTVVVADGTGYLVGSSSSSQVTVNDSLTLSLKLSNTSVREHDSRRLVPAFVTISLSQPRSKDTRFLYCVKNTSTATFRTVSGGKGPDFDLLTPAYRQLSMNNQNCHTYTISSNIKELHAGWLATLGDTTPEARETVVLELRNPPQGVVISSTKGTATFNINNDDGTPPTITVTGGSAVTEGTGAQFTVNASPAPSANLTVQLDVSDDDTSDFVTASDEGRKTVTIPASQTSATFTVNTVADTTDEANGDVTVVVAEGDGYVVGGSSSAQVTVNNTPTLALSLSPTSGNEGNSGSTYVTVNIGLYPAYSGFTQFLLCVKNTGTATFRNASGSEAADFDLVNVNNDTGLAVNAENCHNYNISGGFDISSVRLRIFGDSVAEGNETAVLELRRRSVTPNDVVISATANLATYTITNDDGPDTTVPSLTSITRQTPSTSPTNADSLTWRVIFSEAVKNVNAADFTLTGPNASTVLTVKPVSRSETTTYDVTASGGNLAGLDGTVTLSFNSNHNIQDTAGNDLADSPTPTTGTNENSFVVQNTPTLSLSLASASGNEGDSSNSHVDVTISLSPTRSAATTFNFCVKNTGTAIFRTATDDGEAQDFDIVNYYGGSQLFMRQNCHNYTINGNSGSSQVKLRIFGDTTAEADETAILELRNPPNGVAVSSTMGTATYTINNDDGTPPTITVTGGTAVTEGTGAQFTVNASPAPSANLTVQLDVSDDDMSDFVDAGDEGRKTVTITAGQTSATFTVDTVADTTGEANGDVTVVVASGDGYVVGGSSSAQVTVNDSPILSVRLASTSNQEGKGNGIAINVRNVVMNILLSSTRSTSTAFLFCLKNTGTATFRTASPGTAADFDITPYNRSIPLPMNAQNCHTYTLPAGSARQRAWLKILGDNTPEADETVVLELRDPPNGVAVSSTMGTATYTINNDDGTPPTITVTGGTAVTEGADAQFTVNASTAPSANLTVQLDVSDDDMSDFVAAADEGRKTVTISAGQTSATFTVNTVADTTEEPNGDVTVVVASGDGYVVDTTPTGTATVTVTDDDLAHSITIMESGGTTVSEDGTTTDTYTVVLDNAPSHSVTVTATAGAKATLTFTTTNWNQAQTITVTGVDDDIDNAGDARTVTIAHAASSTDPTSTITNAGSVTVTVTDDETAGLVFDSDAVSVDEGDSSSYTVALASQPSANVTVTISGQAGTDLTVDTDPDMNNDQATLTFTTSNWSVAKTVEIEAGQDDDAANDSITLTHTPSGGGYGSDQNKDLKVTIMEDDVIPTLKVEIPNVTEGETGTVKLTLSPPSSQSIRLSTEIYTVNCNNISCPQGTTPASSSDVPRDARRIIFAPGDTTHTVPLTTTDDSTIESTEVFFLEIAGFAVTEATIDPSTPAYTSRGGSEGPVYGWFVHILDNDYPANPNVTITPGKSPVTEGGVLKFTVTATPAPTSATMVSVVVTEDTSDSQDFVASSDEITHTVTIPASGSQGAGTATLTIATVRDSTSEPNGTVTATVAGGTGYMVGHPSSAMITVNDNDSPANPNVTIIPGKSPVTEGASVTFTVTATPAPTSATTVSVAVTEDTSDSQDFVASSNEITHTVTIPASGSPGAGTATLTIATVGDSTSESNGEVMATVAGSSDYTVGDPSSATVTVNDDDNPANPIITIAHGAAAVTEGESLTFTVTATPAPTAATTVSVAVTEDSGGGQDFLDPADETTHTVTVPASGSQGAGTATLTIATVADGMSEPDGEVTAMVADGTDYTVGDPSAAMVTVSNLLPPLAPPKPTGFMATAGDGEVTLSWTDPSHSTITGWYYYQKEGSGSYGSKIEISGSTATTTSHTVTGLTNGTTYTFRVSAYASNLAGSTEGDPSDEQSATPMMAASVTLSESTLTLTELHATDFEKTYTVVLNPDPGATVEVSVTSSDPSAVTVDTDSVMPGDQSTLTFTHGNSGNWETAQTVTVRAENDGDVAAETVTVSHTATVADTTNPYHQIPISDVTTTTVDAGHGVVVSKASVTVTADSDTDTYTIKLKSQPGGSVEITPASSASTMATVSGALTFTNNNWSAAQTVTVTGAGAGSATISHSVTNPTTAYPANTMIAPVGVTVSHPARNLDIKVTDAYEGENIVVTLTLSRAPGNVTAAQRTFMIDATAPSDANVDTCIASYGCEAGSMAAAYADFGEPNVVNFVFGASETVKTASIPITTDSVSEGVEVVSIEISYNPMTNDYGIFAADSQVTGRNGFAQAPIIDPVNALVNSYSQILGDSRPAPITITESGTPAATTVSEDGTTTTDTYTVVLDSEPSASVTVTARAATGAQVQAPSGTAGATAPLTFTTSNWNQAQTITVTGVDDDIDNAGNARTVTITHVASSSDSNYTIANAGSVSVTVTDDDTAGVTVSSSSHTVAENGGTASYTVVLATEPLSDVVITVTAADETVVKLDGPDQATTYTKSEDLTFTTSNWDRSQTITIQGQDDDAFNASARTTTISHVISSAGNGDGSGYTPSSPTIDSVAVTLTDDDGVTVSFSQSTYSVEEGDVLEASVVLSGTRTSPTQVAVSTTPITAIGNGIDFKNLAVFLTIPAGQTRTNVRLETIEDMVVEGDEELRLDIHEALLPAGVTVGTFWNPHVTIIDNDGVKVSESSLSLEELHASNAEKTYTVVLDPDPGATVEVSVTSGDTSAVTVDTDSVMEGDQSTLTFTHGNSGNWDTAQTVTVRAENDGNVAAETVTLSHTVTASDINNPYHEITISDVTVSITDAGHGVVVSDATLSVNDGDGTATYEVKLKSDPGGTVEVTPRSDTPANDTVSSPLTFTSSNWSTAQQVTVTGKQAGSATISHEVTTATTAYPANTTIASVTVTITAADAVKVSKSSLSLEELHASNAEKTYTVVLNTDPDGTVEVSVTSEDTSAVTVDTDSVAVGDQSTLTFTPGDSGNWDTAQTVTVRAENDGDVVAETVTLSHTAAVSDTNNPYHEITISDVTVSTTDAGHGVVVSDATLLVNDGDDNATYEVELKSDPGGTVEVTPTSSAPANATVSGPLTFTSSNWSTAQQVTVTGKQVGSATISHEVTTATTAYPAATMIDSVSVTVTADRRPTVGISPGFFQVNEGNSAEFTVTLSAVISSDVTIPLSVTGLNSAIAGDDYTVPEQSSVTISAGATSGTFTIATINDDDIEADDELVSVDIDPLKLPATVRAGTMLQGNFTIIDDDGAVTVSMAASTAEVEEGESLEIVVNLGAALDTDVMIDIFLQGNTAIPGTDFNDPVVNSPVNESHSDISVTIPTGATSGSATVTTIDDNIFEGNLRFSAVIQHDNLLAQGLVEGPDSNVTSIKILDNEGVVLVESDGSTTVTELGGTDTYQVQMPGSLSANVSVVATAGAELQVRSGSGSASGSTSLTFASGAAASNQTVIVSAVDDEIDNPGGSRTATITHVTTSTAYSLDGLIVEDITVSITDDDPTTVSLASTCSGNLTEGQTRDFTVTLGRGLIAGETLTVPLTFGGTATRGTDYTMTGTTADGIAYNNLNNGTASVVFTGPNSGTTATAATISLTAAADSTNESTPETVDIGFGTLAHTGLAGGADETDSLDEFSIEDGPGVTVSTSSLSLEELHTSDAEKTYTVKLNTDPGANVEVSVTSGDPSAVTVDTDSVTDGDQSTLTFTTSNWDKAQTVTLRALNDGDVVAETVTVSHTAKVSSDSTNPYHQIPISAVTATTVDAGHGVVVSKASVTVVENSDTDTYTIKLKSQPGGSVEITPRSSASANATVSGVLTFTNANWSTAQTVTVTGVSPGAATISHAVTTGTTTYPVSTMIASVGVTVSPAARNLDIQVADAYEGEDITLTLTLSRAPGNVAEALRTFTVNPDVPSDASVTTCIADHGCEAGSTAAAAADFTATSMDVVFGTSETVKTVSIPTATDSVSEGVEVVRIGITYNSPGMDDLGIFTSGSTQVTGRNNFDGVAPLVFPTNIIVSSYGQILGDSRPVPITITEAGGTTTVSEDGTTTTDTYTVVLDSQPSANVTVTASADTGVQVQGPGGTADTTATLTFTTSNWNQAQTITVSGVDDDIDNAGDARTVTIAHAASSTDLTYTITAAGSVSVTVTDDDMAGLVFTPDPVSVAEGESGSYTAKLASQPSADVTVTISGQAGTDLMVDTDSGMAGDQATLTFTTSNWRVAQTVAIEAGQDDDATNDSITLAHTPSGGGYGSDQNKNLEVTITDDEIVPTLKVDIATVTEGETGTITLTLSQEASQSFDISVGDTTINSCGSGITCPQGTTEAGSPADYSFTGITVTFAPGDRSKTVSFTTTDDSTSESTEVFLFQVTSLSASEATIDSSTPADVTNFGNPAWFVRIQDNDNPGNPNVTITPGTSPVTEGATATFTVSATPAPTVATTVSVVVTEDSSGNQDFVASSNEITHTVTIPAASSSAAGTVTLTIATVGDSRNEPTGEVTATVAGSTGYTVGNPSSAMVTVNDDDNPANPNVTIAHGAASVSEGESLTFTVSATPAPTVATPVSVAVTEDSSNGQDFLAASDETTHTVTVTAAGSEGEGTATLTIATVFNSTSDPQGKVTAMVAGGTRYTVGNPSSAMVTVRNLNPPPIPPKPTGFMATAGDGEVTLSWNDPSRSTITWWQYRQKEGSGSYGSLMRIPGSTATTTSYTVTGLTNGTTYTFQVGAVASNLARTAGGLVSDEQSATPMMADTTAPTVTSIERQTPSSSPTNADSLTWRVTFSEAVVNMNAADFTLTGPNSSTTLAVTPVTGSETTTYDVTASGGNLASYDGTVTLSFNSGHNIEDTSGNDLASSPATPSTNQDSFVVDNTAPTVSAIRRQTPSSSPTNADSLTWRVTFDEPVQQVDTTDFQVSGSPATTVTITGVARDGSTNAYDVTASGGNLANYDGTVTLSFNSGHNIEDEAGNDLASNPTPTTNQNSFVVDNMEPSVAISGLSGTISGAATATFTFNETVSGFDTSDIVVSNSAVSVFAEDTAGTSWTATITPNTNGTEVTINVAAGAARDEAGNNSTAATPVTVNYTAPLSAPVGFTANGRDERVELSWAAPSDSAGTAQLSQYQYRYQEGSSVTKADGWTDVADSDDDGDVNDETALTVTGLTNGSEYAFELKAVNGAGDGAVAIATAPPASSDTTAPTVTSIERQTPSSSPTNADSLTWRVTVQRGGGERGCGGFHVDGTEQQHHAGSDAGDRVGDHHL